MPEYSTTLKRAGIESHLYIVLPYSEQTTFPIYWTKNGALALVYQPEQRIELSEKAVVASTIRKGISQRSLGEVWQVRRVLVNWQNPQQTEHNFSLLRQLASLKEDQWISFLDCQDVILPDNILSANLAGEGGSPDLLMNQC